jgi:type II secretory pathway component PulM
MEQTVIGLLTLLALVLVGVLGQQYTKQQSQIDFLRETLTEFMNKTTEYVSAQNDANGAVIDTLEKDEEYIQNSSRAITALAAHVQYLDNEIQKKCNNASYNKLGGHG